MIKELALSVKHEKNRVFKAYLYKSWKLEKGDKTYFRFHKIL